MNFTSPEPLSNENSSEETNDWNSTATTVSPWTPLWFSKNIGLTYTTVVVLWIVFVVGTLGNILVLVVLLWRRSGSQVGTQLFVGSLAVADLGLMFSSVWVKAYDLLQSSWQFGAIPCKFQFLWHLLTMNCSIWTLAALSTDRYLYALKYHYNTVNVCVYVFIKAERR